MPSPLLALLLVASTSVMQLAEPPRLALIREVRVAWPGDAGPVMTDRFPRDEVELRSAGDFDGDGHDDLLVMMRHSVPDWGRLYDIDVRSGDNGGPLFRWPSRSERESERVIDAAAVGDVDGDGHADLLMSVELRPPPARVQPCARIRLVAGGAAEVIREHAFEGGVSIQIGGVSSEYAGYGAVLGAAGDVDRDGTPDYFVAAPGAHGRPKNGGRSSLLGQEISVGRGLGSGIIDVFSGRTGAILWSQAGIALENGFGAAAGSIGDVNGDGVPDLAVGAPASLGLHICQFCLEGELFVLSGTDGEVVAMREGRYDADGLGRTIVPLGDVDDDGRPDLAVGALSCMLPSPLDTLVLSSSGLQVLRTIDNSLLGTNCTASVRSAGDVDGDGKPELVVYSGLEHRKIRSDCRREVHVVSAASGRSLFSIAPDVEDPWFGCAAGPAGDVDGDGRGDVAVCLGTEVQAGRSMLRIGLFGQAASGRDSK